MAKKYLSIEEAAKILGMDPGELNRLREKGDIRAFADRGTWKFRQDEIEELSRSRQPDSNPDVPLGDYDDDDLSETIFFGEEKESDSGPGSSITLGREEPALGEQPTIIRRNPVGDKSSDSDVRLIIDEKFQPAPGLDEGDDSDSDVKLKFDADDSSDSDVKLVGSDAATLPDLGKSDSDVRLAPQKGADRGSDSDVQLISSKSLSDSTSDSDVALVEPGKPSKTSKPASGKSKGKAAPPSDDVLSLDFDLDQDDASDGSFVLGAEQSGISLGGPGDSGIALDTGDSGIALDAGDSGISLDIGDSGIALDADSGITLAGDSGISLAGPSDSGIGLENAGSKSGKKSGIKKGRGKPKVEDDDDLGGTIPMMPTYGVQDNLGDTQMEVPMLGGKEDSDFEFASNSLDDDSDSTNVIMLEGEDSADERAATMVQKGRKSFDDDDTDDSVFDVQEPEEEEAVADDDLEVADDILGEDDEIEEMEDVFGADDEDFDDDLQSGQSHAEFVAPVGRMAAPVEVEWGADALAGLGISSLLMCVTGWVMYDLVRTMWTGAALSGPTTTLLDSVKGFFG